MIILSAVVIRPIGLARGNSQKKEIIKTTKKVVVAG